MDNKVYYADLGDRTTCEWGGKIWQVNEWEQTASLYGNYEVTLKLTSLSENPVKKKKGKKEMEPSKEKPNFLIVNFLADPRYATPSGMLVGQAETNFKALELAKAFLENQPQGGPRVRLVIFKAITEVATPSVEFEVKEITITAPVEAQK